MSDEEYNGWKHKVDMLRGEMTAFKQSIAKLAQTGLDAAKANPPFLPCVLERLEQILEKTK